MRLMVVFSEMPLYLAVMVSTWLPPKVPVDAIKVAAVALAGAATVAGTVRTERLEVNVTMAPLVGAGRLRVTVQVLEELGPRLVGLHDTEDTSTAARVSKAVVELPL